MAVMEWALRTRLADSAASKFSRVSTMMILITRAAKGETPERT
jgi:hypothetical protein